MAFCTNGGTKTAVLVVLVIGIAIFHFAAQRPNVVIFYSNGGNGTIDVKSVKRGAIDIKSVIRRNSIVLPQGSSLTRDGYTFGGWNTKHDGTGTNYEGNSQYKLDSCITLYAKWNAIPQDHYALGIEIKGDSTDTLDNGDLLASAGGGDPRARVTQMGVLGIVSGQIKGKSVESADIFGKGGFATDIDAILSGVGGLKSGGVGRKGAAGIGYGSGYGSGFDGGGGGIDDLLGGLMGSGLDSNKRGELTASSPDFLKGRALTGGRSRASIQRVVMQNMAALRYDYNRRLRDKPGLNGKITVKFAIDEFGKVIFAQMVESTMDDSEFESTVVDKVKSWNFEKIDKPGDVTEVVYPFVFSQ